VEEAINRGRAKAGPYLGLMVKMTTVGPYLGLMAKMTAAGPYPNIITNNLLRIADAMMLVPTVLSLLVRASKFLAMPTPA
jgi:hypothetical protein